MEFTIDISDEALALAFGCEVESVEDAFSQLDNEELEEVLSDRAISYARSHRGDVEVSDDDSFGDDGDDDDYDF